MIGDYLIESRCRHGHTSSATFRGYPRSLVEDVARALDDRCHWQDESTHECGQRVAHVVTVINPPPSTRMPPKRTNTRPSMPAVIIVNDTAPVSSSTLGEVADDEQSTDRPPPSTEEPPEEPPW